MSPTIRTALVALPLALLGLCPRSAERRGYDRLASILGAGTG